MKEWVEQHLLTEKGDKLSGKRINQKWFQSRGFDSQYQALLDINPDPTLACKIVLGLTSKCKLCENTVILPRVYCSYKCMARCPEWKATKQKTMIERYGVENAFESGPIREKILQNHLMKYGTKTPISTKEIQKKVRDTNIKRYGVARTSMLPTSIERYKKTMVERYGAENPQKIKEFKKKTAETNIERYGHICPFGSPVVQEKIKSTNFARYGVSHPSKLKSTQEKKVHTNFIRYNVGHVTQEHYSEELKTALLDNLRGVSGVLDSVFDGISQSSRYNLIHRYRPELATKQNSLAEQNIILHIKSVYSGTIVESDRKILDGLELDVYLPDLKLAFEYNGTYWHSDVFKDKQYHQKKSLIAKEKGIRLVHLYEYDGPEKNLEIINNTLDRFSIKIFGRKCVVREITKEEEKAFTNKHHRYGSAGSSVKLGLFFESELVQVATFGLSRFNKLYEYELIRMCSKKGHQIQGGASKLLSYFIKKWKPKSIMTYSHLDNGANTVYEKIGFSLLGISPPSYVWVSNTEILSRYKTQMINEDKTMKAKGYLKVYNAGNESFGLICK